MQLDRKALLFFYRRRDQWIRGNYRPSKDGGALADGPAQAGVLSSERSGSLLSPAEAHAVIRQDNGPLERLGVILSMPRAIEDDDIWEDYLKSIHSKLVGGSTLKQGMSLAYAVKILHAGWLRDGTWAGTTETAQFSSTSNPTSVARVNQTMQPFRIIPDGQPSPAYATYMPSRMSDPRPISHLPSPSSISTHHSARDKAELVESPLSA